MPATITLRQILATQRARRFWVADRAWLRRAPLNAAVGSDSCDAGRGTTTSWIRTLKRQPMHARNRRHLT
jgi:hypothetical protein